MELRIIRYDKVTSTNLVVREHIESGAEEGLCIVASEQTAGSGRNGRNWHSPPGAGLYLSILLRPKFPSRFAPLITLAAAVAVSELLEEEHSITSEIKWPNDVLVDGKKISGILAEMVKTDLGPAVILGIGINRRKQEVANSISIEEATGKPWDAEALTNSAISSVAKIYRQLEFSEGRKMVRDKWCSRSSFCRDKQVSVEMGGKSISGITQGISETGALRLKTAEGEFEVLAGDVRSVRPESPYGN